MMIWDDLGPKDHVKPYDNRAAATACIPSFSERLSLLCAGGGGMAIRECGQPGRTLQVRSGRACC
jgi:hypothetical protein